MADTPRAFFACAATDTIGVEWTIAYMLADLVIIAMEGNELSGWGPLAHHLIVAFGFSKGIVTGFTTQYHVLFLINEMSTVFLHLARLLKGAPKAAQAVNALLLWVAFLVCRLACNAWIFANVGWHLSRPRHPTAPSEDSQCIMGSANHSDPSPQARASLRMLIDDPSTFRELCLQLGLAGAAQILNIFWFYKLTLMVVKKLPSAMQHT